MPNEDGFEPGQPVTFEQIMQARGRTETAALPTRDEIASMPKAEVVDWLQAHGVDEPKGKVSDLREELTRIMYMEA